MNHIDVTAGNREIPAGKVLLADRLTADCPRPVKQVLDTKTGWGRTTVKLVAVSAGWACAGSMMRWDNGHFAVSWDVGASTHGARYKSLDDAQAHFNRIPA
jgi:hypothetical protein